MDNISVISSSPMGPSLPTAVTAQPAPHQVHDPGHVTGTLTGPCYARDGGKLPDTRCTPGAYDPSLTKAVLCSPGYRTTSYRPPADETDKAKYNVVEPAYGLNNVSGELDHLIPLELGGSNNLSNLWVEPGKIPNPKDKIETTLHARVCAGAISLRTAQLAIARDWTTALSG
jgi:hypothetical protein